MASHKLQLCAHIIDCGKEAKWEGVDGLGTVTDFCLSYEYRYEYDNSVVVQRPDEESKDMTASCE